VLDCEVFCATTGRDRASTTSEPRTKANSFLDIIRFSFITLDSHHGTVLLLRNLSTIARCGCSIQGRRLLGDFRSYRIFVRIVRDLGVSPKRPAQAALARGTGQERYYDFNVRTGKKRIEKLRYMHRNPVTRGLVEKPEDWPWGSFRNYATGEEATVEIESPWTARKRERIGIR
jgi:hypothetical protein